MQIAGFNSAVQDEIYLDGGAAVGEMCVNESTLADEFKAINYFGSGLYDVSRGLYSSPHG